MMITDGRHAYIDSTRGLEVRTARTRKELITDLILNSGPEIAEWIESEGKRVADLWREAAVKEADNA